MPLLRKIWQQLELQSTMAPPRSREWACFQTTWGQEGKHEGKETHSERHASLNTGSTDTLTCKRRNCPAPARHRKKEGGEKRVENIESGCNPSWISHLVRKEKQGRKEMSSSYSKMHRHTEQVL